MSSRSFHKHVCIRNTFMLFYSLYYNAADIAMDSDALYQLVGERIRDARNRASLSQAKLAEKLQMSRTSVVNIEAGRQRLPLHVLWQVAEELGTEAALLLPKQSDYQKQTQPISLNKDMIEKIEEAANGDPATRINLTNFISKIKAQGKR